MKVMRNEIPIPCMDISSTDAVLVIKVGENIPNEWRSIKNVTYTYKLRIKTLNFHNPNDTSIVVEIYDDIPTSGVKVSEVVLYPGTVTVVDSSMVPYVFKRAIYVKLTSAPSTPVKLCGVVEAVFP